MLSTGPFYVYCMYYNFSRQNYTQMLLIIWSLENMTLFFMVCVLFYTVNVNQKSILSLINEGMKILNISRRSGKSLTILFIKLFVIDHIALILQCSTAFIMSFDDLEAKILGSLCFAMNFISFFTTNAFAFMLILVWLEFKAINANMASDILHENHLSFLEDLRVHRRLRSFCHRVIRIFSKICIANMLYAFSTTISAVRIQNPSPAQFFLFDIFDLFIEKKNFLSLFLLDNLFIHLVWSFRGCFWIFLLLELSHLHSVHIQPNIYSNLLCQETCVHLWLNKANPSSVFNKCSRRGDGERCKYFCE